MHLALTVKALRVMQFCLKGRQGHRGDTLVDRGQGPLRGQGVVAAAHHTRHTVSGLVEWKRQGITDARILEHHPDLTPADLEAAWAYYATHREEIDQAIKEAADA